LRPPLLEVRDLTIEFPSPEGIVRAVDEVSFEVAAGETVGLVGESGSGKSVTALSIMRMLTPRARVVKGSIRFLGEEMLSLAPEALRDLRGREISLVFQDPLTSLNPLLSVRERVEEVIRHHGRAGRLEVRSRAEEALGRVGIQRSRFDEHPHRFSGGMRQRVTLAIAIANQPKLILADEPTTALDVTIQAQILDLMRGLCTEFGTAVMLITHNLGVVAGLCQKIIVMYAGNLVESAPTPELFANPRHPYTLGLLKSIPRLDEKRKERLIPIEGLPPDLVDLPRGCSFAARCVYAVDRSHEEVPQLRQVGPDHYVACWVDVNGGKPA